VSDDDWTPYGLEAFRQSSLRRRRLALAGLLVVLAVAYVGVTQFAVDERSSTAIDTFGGDGSTIGLENPNPGPPSPDATLTLSPGQLNVPDSAVQASDDPGQTPAFPEGDRPAVEPINWTGVLVQWGIPLALVLFGYILGRGRDEDTEVNYGVYKGAMPMEQISARYSHLVETTRATYQDPFGKRRPHYLPDEEAGTEGSSTDS
jgi:hypothetical protein